MTDSTCEKRASSHLKDDDKWSRAAFSIFSVTLTPQEITQRLGLQPTRTHEKGQPKGFRRKDGSISPLILWKDSAWHLNAPLKGDQDLAEHIKSLLDILEPIRDDIKSLSPECTLIRLFCGFSSGSGQGGFSLDSQTLGRLSKLDLPLVLDLYPPSDPEEAADLAQEDSSIDRFTSAR
ncbi:MAG: DUF4279 domain-containing protein [Terriglobales bacterium]